ncbi:hypothetical protein Ancab_000933 [Ancistrocladus abbreviatus]
MAVDGVGEEAFIVYSDKWAPHLFAQPMKSPQVGRVGELVVYEWEIWAQRSNSVGYGRENPEPINPKRYLKPKLRLECGENSVSCMVVWWSQAKLNQQTMHKACAVTLDQTDTFRSKMRIPNYGVNAATSFRHHIAIHHPHFSFMEHLQAIPNCTKLIAFVKEGSRSKNKA